MDKADQKRIAEELTTRVLNNLKDQIDADLMPSDFDGFEIRWLLADMFTREGAQGSRLRKLRYKRYMRTCTTCLGYQSPSGIK
jgi:hypothetical protein